VERGWKYVYDILTMSEKQGSQLFLLLPWAPLCLAEIIRDYVFLAPGTSLYSQDYQMRSSWDATFYIIAAAEYRKHRGRHVLKYQVNLCTPPKKQISTAWIIETYSPQYPDLKINGMFYRIH
jgi:hypothetical protein